MQRAHTFSFVLWLIAALIFMLTNWTLWNEMEIVGLVGLAATAPVIRIVLIAGLAAISVQFVLAQLWARSQNQRIRALERELNATRAELYQRRDAQANAVAPSAPAPHTVVEPATGLQPETDHTHASRTLFRGAR